MAVKQIHKKNVLELRRVLFSNALADIVSDSDKIIVMGHKRPDFDAIGACVGIYTSLSFRERVLYYLK